ncbi:MAG: hypothetical protein LBR08_09375 [Bacteroidales bacterium]|nr:hypothetical protein [Bacteroidales bacterium]
MKIFFLPFSGKPASKRAVNTVQLLLCLLMKKIVAADTSSVVPSREADDAGDIILTNPLISSRRLLSSHCK